VGEGVPPHAILVAIGHAAKAEGLNHEEFDDKGRRCGGLVDGGWQLTLPRRRLIFHWSFSLYHCIYYGNKTEFLRCPLGQPACQPSCAESKFAPLKMIRATGRKMGWFATWKEMRASHPDRWFFPSVKYTNGHDAAIAPWGSGKN
jgi:hypothetical protein